MYLPQHLFFGEYIRSANWTQVGIGNSDVLSLQWEQTEEEKRSLELAVLNCITGVGGVLGCNWERRSGRKLKVRRCLAVPVSRHLKTGNIYEVRSFIWRKNKIICFNCPTFENKLSLLRTKFTRLRNKLW